jgi:penicillin-binding protein 1A
MGLFSRKPPQSAPAPSRKRRSLLGRLAFIVPVYLTIIAVVGFAATMFYCSAVYPDPLSLRPAEHPPLIQILARDGSLLAERGGADDYVPYDMLPRHVVDAVIATEDQHFYEHFGVDPFGMLRAAITNFRRGRFVQGGSTLTQQLAKNLYLSSERTMTRKLEEFALALWLEARLTKQDIVELYLNRVYLGSGAYGIDAAARRYFGKSAGRLTLAESALIAGLLKAPSRYSPRSNPAGAAARGRLVLSQMLDAGFITKDEESAAAFAMSTVAQAKGKSEATGTEYAVDYVLDQLPPSVRKGKSEVIVETTLDPALLTRTSEVVDQLLDERGDLLQASQAAVVVLDPDGGIRALQGGRSYSESQYDRAVKALRQPGSAFKPFVYLAALEAGMTPDTIVEDAPLSISGWAPRNDNGQYQGPMTLRTALARSVNTVAVRLALKVGPTRVAAMARRLGITSPLGRDASIALGTSEVSLLELTSAYNVLANGGHAAEPYVVRRIFTRSGRVLYVRTPSPQKQLVALSTVGAMNDMLNATLVYGTGKRAALPEHPAAGKTGTSQSYRDAWFVGYTAQMTTGVWTGNDDGSAMNHVVGGTLPARIWREVMISALAGKVPLALKGTEARGTAATRHEQLAPPGAMHPGIPIDPGFIDRAAMGRATTVGDARRIGVAAGPMSIGRND